MIIRSDASSLVPYFGHSFLSIRSHLKEMYGTNHAGFNTEHSGGIMNKFICIVIIIVAFLLLNSVSGWAQEDYSRSEKLVYEKFRAVNKSFEKGKKFHAAGNLVKARKEFQDVVERMSEHADAYFFLSQISYKEGKIDEALEEIQKAKDNYRFIAKMKINMHQIMINQLREQQDDIEERLNAMREAAAVATGTQKSKLSAEVTKLEGQKNTIVNRLNEPVPEEEETPSDYFYFHGNIFVKQKKYQEAHDQYMEAVRINPKHGDAYNNLASLYYMVKKYSQAMEYLKLAEENGAQVNPKFKEELVRRLRK